MIFKAPRNTIDNAVEFRRKTTSTDIIIFFKSTQIQIETNKGIKHVILARNYLCTRVYNYFLQGIIRFNKFHGRLSFVSITIGTSCWSTRIYVRADNEKNVEQSGSKVEGKW